MSILFYLLAFLFSGGQLGRISFFGQQVNVYAFEIIIAVLVVLFYRRYKLQPILIIIRKLRSLPIFFGLLVLTFVANWAGFTFFENAVSFFYIVRLFMYFVWFTYFTYYLRHEKNAGKIAGKSFLVFCVLTVITSVLQYFFYPDLRNLYYLGWDPHLSRMFGLFFDTSVAGAIYALLLSILFVEEKSFGRYTRLTLVCPAKRGQSSLEGYILEQIHLRVVYRRGRWLLLGFFFVFSALSFSRSLYLSLFLVGSIELLARHKIRQLLFLLLIFAALIAIIPKPFGEGVNLARTVTVSSRLTDYKNGLLLWQARPLFGYGYNRIRYLKEKIGVLAPESEDMTHAGASFHSTFLIVLVTTGVAGLAAFLLLLLELARLHKNVATVTLLLGLLSLSDNIILHPFVLLLFLGYAGTYAVNLFEK
ncbi:O-antigen ligase family protein [Candidatus Roizmanbacteria bacterium]|nr:O-antigen ligase family protein [Candidatus Roizmanbacteria bacterium]